MSERADAHQTPGMLVRPDPHRRKAGETELRERGWTMNDFVDACLALVAANPDAMLRRLSQFRKPRPRGRPKKTT